MSTRLLSLLLAFSLLWSTFMTVGGAVRGGEADSVASVVATETVASAASDHFASHVAGTQTAALDESPSSPTEHPLHDQPAQGAYEAAVEPLAILVSVPETQAPPLSMAPPPALALAAWPAPHLDGLKRPPRPTALVG